MLPAAATTDDRIPVHVLTGFLGSGKTTFLRHLLGEPELADTAVIINEFGEVGLDHLLVREVSEDAVLLSSGCLCCAVRDDLVSTLADLLAMVRRGKVAPFRRVVVETTGLADPAPIMQAVMSDIKLRRGYRAGSIVATVDGVSGANSIGSFAEAVQQVALADCVVITKSDLVEPWRLDALGQEVGKLNPQVRQLVSSRSSMPGAGDIFRYDEDWEPRHFEMAETPMAGQHSDGIETFAVEIDREVDWAAFVDWLELLLAGRGQSILRVKGLLAVKGDPRPVVIHGVQHVVYPPEYLPRWPQDTARGWLVFIARNLSRSAIERSLPSTFAAAN
ncbi:CobW family GTP-binding protein [Aminobacter aminovorans]|uniref:Cobalamin biosynthesis protein P47K n=1 Tax=Aminobacter aminovorans TaxID=83263 RepID=A0AAC8YUX0_AMIAI|nr:GTP-binding protein [Aminobacter aminovorans]AMS44539.1 cobalamin biosynthesis protein P47K [Aminobacter aminovorans]MBB3710391.1 G3E family GTPase [Aminobacter aminovorans]